MAAHLYRKGHGDISKGLNAVIKLNTQRWACGRSWLLTPSPKTYFTTFWQLCPFEQRKKGELGGKGHLYQRKEDRARLQQRKLWRKLSESEEAAERTENVPSKPVEGEGVLLGKGREGRPGQMRTFTKRSSS